MWYNYLGKYDALNDKNQQLSCWHLAFLYCTELRNYFLTIPDIKDYRFAGDGQQYMAALGWLRLGPLLFSGVTVMVLAVTPAGNLPR